MVCPAGSKNTVYNYFPERTLTDMAQRKYDKYCMSVSKSDFTYVKHNIVTHCMYHNKLDYCDENLIRQAYDNVKKQKIAPTFYTVLNEMDKLLV